MKIRHVPSALVLSLVLLVPAVSFAGEVGAVLRDDPQCRIWWAAGAYKIKRTDPCPTREAESVVIRAARNEYEPFEIILLPKIRLSRVRVEAGPLRHESGAEIAAANVSISLVGYVTVSRPTDESGAAGDWPDPLPPYEGPFEAPPAENRPLWFTIYVPPTAPVGDYRGAVTFSSDGWSAAVPVRLHVWNFTLPRQAGIRSGFGISASDIGLYHNLETRQELEKVFDLYMENYRAHRIAPISPFELYPLNVKFKGIPWQGGEFVSDFVHAGHRALKIEDASPTEAVEARSAEAVPVRAGIPYRLSFWAKTASEGQDYTVFLEPFNAEQEPLHGLNILKVFKGSTAWKEEAVEIPGFLAEVKTVVLRLFPTFRDEAGSRTGTAWFDDIALTSRAGAANLIPGGDFEMDIDRIAVETDFREFDRGARRYIGEFGFNAFDLPVQGLGTGSFYSRQEGLFGGFRQGTAEYDRLLSQHLGQVERHLKENGWLGKEYIYWFDEPGAKDYPFVREGMSNIRKNAPRLTRFITEHEPGPDIMDVSEVGCTIFHRVNPKVVAELAAKGREFWSYLCTGPKAPWVTLFIDHPAVNMRIWLWMSYRFGLKGILVWRANYWTSPTVFPPGAPENPWADPMSYTVGYGVPYGAVELWGNGDGRFLYPPNKHPGVDKTKYICGPVNSIRWEVLREGAEDYEYFRLLEKLVREAGGKARQLAQDGRGLLAFPDSLFTSGREYTKDPEVLLDYRMKIAEAIERLAAASK